MGAHLGETVAAGDVERLFREESPRLWRSLVAYSRDPELASDAVSEAFTLALESPVDILSARGWVWRVAFRLATKELKRRPRSAGREVDQISWPEPAVELLSTLSGLTPRQRAAVVLFYYADQPVEAIARILDSTSAAVRVHLMRGRRRLREILEQDDE